MAQRQLTSNAAGVAAARLGCHKRHVLWRVLYVLLERALYLWYYIQKYGRVSATADTLHTLFERAGRLITSAALDRRAKQHLSIDDAALAAKGLTNDCHWVAAAVRLTPLLPDAAVEEAAADAMEFFLRVSARMHAHLDLGARNIERTTWLSAEILSADPLVARAGANKLRDALIRRQPDCATKYENVLINDAALMHQISLMADDPQPECVWRKMGRCAYLFMFLADRFHGAPDTVIDCESIHAQWQRLGASRRNLKLLLTNALLKLRSYLQSHGGLPSYPELEPHIDLVHTSLTQGFAAAVGRRSHGDHWHDAATRFNLRPEDVPLLSQWADQGAGPPSSKEERMKRKWANYLRSLFYTHHLYRCTGLAADRYFYVVENKVVAYRDEPGP